MTRARDAVGFHVEFWLLDRKGIQTCFLAAKDIPLVECGGFDEGEGELFSRDEARAVLAWLRQRFPRGEDMHLVPCGPRPDPLGRFFDHADDHGKPLACPIPTVVYADHWCPVDLAWFDHEAEAS